MEAKGKSRKLKIFISYARANADLADRIAAILEQEGLEPIIDRRSLPYGEEWQKMLGQFIRDCDVVLYLLSSAAIKSNWCSWELQQVSDLRKRLVPVAIERLAYDQLPPSVAAIEILPRDTAFDLVNDEQTLLSTLQTDQEWLIESTRLADRAWQWKLAGRRPDLLLVGRSLSNTETWRKNQPDTAPSPSPEILDLIAASYDSARRKQRRWIAFSSVAAVVAGAVVVLVVYLNTSLTQVNTDLTSTNDKLVSVTKDALQQRDRAQISNAKNASMLSDQLVAKGQRTEALKLLVETLQDLPKENRSVTESELNGALYRALWLKAQRRSLPYAYLNSINHAQFYGDAILVSSKEGQTIELIDARTGKTLQHFLTYPGQVLASAMSRDRSRVAVVSQMNYTTTEFIEFFTNNPNPMPNMSVDVSKLIKFAYGRQPVLWYGPSDLLKTVSFPDGKSWVWEGKNLVAKGQTGVIAVSEDQYSLISQKDKRIALHDLRDNAEIVIPGASPGFFSLSADGKLAASIIKDGEVQFWSLRPAPRIISSSSDIPITGKMPLVAWSPSADRFGLYEDNSIRIFCLPAGVMCQQVDLKADKVLAMRFDTAGRKLQTLVQDASGFGASILEFLTEDLGYRFELKDLRKIVMAADGESVVALTSGKLEIVSGIAKIAPESAKLMHIKGSVVHQRSLPDDLSKVVPLESGGMIVANGAHPTKILILDQDLRTAKTFTVPGVIDVITVNNKAEIVITAGQQLLKYDLEGKLLGQRNTSRFMKLGRGGRYATWSDDDNVIVIFDIERMQIIPQNESCESINLVGEHHALLRTSTTAVLRDLDRSTPDRAISDMDGSEDDFVIDGRADFLASIKGPTAIIRNLRKGSRYELTHGPSVDVGINDHVLPPIFAADSSSIVTGGADGKVNLWTIDGKFVTELLSFPSGISELFASTKGSRDRIVAESQSQSFASVKLLPVRFTDRERMARDQILNGGASTP